MTEVGSLPLRVADVVQMQMAKKLASCDGVLGTTTCVATAGAQLPDCPVCITCLTRSTCPLCSAYLACSACPAATGGTSRDAGKLRVTCNGSVITDGCDCANRVPRFRASNSSGCICAGGLVCIPGAAAVSHFDISAGGISNDPG